MFKLVVKVQENSSIAKKGFKKAVMTTGTKKHCQEMGSKCGLEYEIIKIK